jgi:hypothetical protein
MTDLQRTFSVTGIGNGSFDEGSQEGVRMNPELRL